MVKLGSLSQAVLDGAKWRGRDKYPAWQCYADELEHLLAFASKYDQAKRFASRIQADQRARNSALAELRVASALEDRGFEFTEWEPLGQPPQRGEFLIRAADVEGVFVEVKAPDWHAEITGFSDVSRSPERRKLVEARKRQPKYRDGAGGAYDPSSGIAFAVQKAYSKLTAERPNLLVIPSDDLFVSYQHEPQMIADLRLFSRDGLFSDPRYERLGALAMFWYEVRNDRVVYELETFANPYALLAVMLPDAAMRRLHQQLPKFPVVSLGALWGGQSRMH